MANNPDRAIFAIAGAVFSLFFLFIALRSPPEMGFITLGGGGGGNTTININQTILNVTQNITNNITNNITADIDAIGAMIEGNDTIQNITIASLGNWSADSSNYYTSSQVNLNFLKNSGDTANGNYSFDSGTLFIDASNEFIGIRTETPTQVLDVEGNARINGTLNVTQNITTPKLCLGTDCQTAFPATGMSFAVADANFVNKTKLDGNFTNFNATWDRFLQNNYTIINATKLSVSENATIAHIGSCSAGQYATATITGGVTCSTPASTPAAPVVGLTTSSNSTYSVVEYNMEYTVATYERITTAPTRNTTCGVMTCLNFPSANTVGSDGGFITGGATATNGANFNVTNMTYFGIKLRLTATANRRDILGYFKSGTTVIQNTSFTGVAFKLNTTRGNNWNCSVAEASAGTWQDSGVTADTVWHFYEITQNSTHYNFFIDGTMRCSVTRATQPRTLVASVGTWVESTTTTVVVEVIDWLRHESWRSPDQ